MDKEVSVEENRERRPFDDSILDRMERPSQKAYHIQRALTLGLDVSTSYIAYLIGLKLDHAEYAAALRITRKIKDERVRLDQQLRINQFWRQSNPRRHKAVGDTYMQLFELHKNELHRELYKELARESYQLAESSKNKRERREQMALA